MVKGFGNQRIVFGSLADEIVVDLKDFRGFLRGAACGRFDVEEVGRGFCVQRKFLETGDEIQRFSGFARVEAGGRGQEEGFRRAVGPPFRNFLIKRDELFGVFEGDQNLSQKEFSGGLAVVAEMGPDRFCGFMKTVEAAHQESIFAEGFDFFGFRGIHVGENGFVEFESAFRVAGFLKEPGGAEFDFGREERVLEELQLAHGQSRGLVLVPDGGDHGDHAGEGVEQLLFFGGGAEGGAVGFEGKGILLGFEEGVSVRGGDQIGQRIAFILEGVHDAHPCAAGGFHAVALEEDVCGQQIVGGGLRGRIGGILHQQLKGSFGTVVGGDAKDHLLESGLADGRGSGLLADGVEDFGGGGVVPEFLEHRAVGEKGSQTSGVLGSEIRENAFIELLGVL